MNKADLQEILDFSRRKTLDLLDSIAKRPDPAVILGWRPGLGRAHIGWQLMHVAATDDRHLYVRMKGGTPVNPDWVRRFAGGSIPDDDVPSVAAIRQYLAERRQELVDHLNSLAEADLDQKPNDQAPWVYREWFKVLAWHEAHHQGQAHLTLNLYRITQELTMAKVGH
jgi:DinB family protein